MSTMPVVDAVRSVSRRRLVLGGAGGAVVTVAALAGCGVETGTSAAKQTGPVTLTYVSHLGETHPEGKGYLDLLDEYSKTNQEKITLQLEDARPATNYDKMLALAAAGTAPDLARIDSTRGSSLFVPGATIDMEELLKKDKDWAKQKADMYPGHVDNSTWGGKLISLPTYQAMQGIVYNPKLLARAGLSVPKAGWTWTDFKESAQKATRAPDSWGLSFAWIMHHTLSWAGTMGASFVSADKRKMTVNTPEMIEAAEFVVSLIRGGITAPEESTELFQKGTDAAVFEQTGPFRMPTFRQKGITDFGVIHHPIHPTKKLYSGYTDGSEIVVFKGVTPERQTAAGRVALWLNAPYAQAKQCIKATVVPVSKGALNSKELQDYLKTDPQFKGFVDASSLGKAARFPALPSYALIVNMTLTPGMKEIYGQKISARDGLGELQRKTQVMLDDDLKRLGM